MTDANDPAKKSAMQRFLGMIEALGNRLPHPTILFIGLTLFILALTAIFSALGMSVETPTGLYEINNLIGNAPIELQNPRNGQVYATYDSGWQYLFNTLTPNFVNFAPFGMVVVIMIAIGVAEHSGLIGATIRKLVTSVPAYLVTPTVVFAGVMANIAADAGYFVLIPLGPLVFWGLGRHPLAGLAAAFAGVSGGFSANLVITSLDPLLGGFTQPAAAIGDGLLGTDFAATMNIATMNYYFLIVSTFFVVLIGTLVVERIVEPHLGTYSPPESADVPAMPDGISADETRALRKAGLAALAYIAVIVCTAIPVDSNIPLLGVFSTATLPPETVEALVARYGSVNLTHAPLFHTQIIVTMLFFFFLIPGLVYGRSIGAFANGADFVRTMEKATVSMAGFIVMVFFMAQFIAYFNASNIGIVIAMQGAELLEKMPADSTGGLIVLIFGFVVLSGFINLFMGSASAKWAILAPIFVPVMMTVGITPAATQMLYRIGDSSTNLITPLMTYFAFVITVGAKYRPGFGIGSLVSLMLPFSISFMLGWTVLFLLWAFAGLPLGPGEAIFFTVP
ncbi:p-aminobenzoyl-glutamate transport protein [Shimia sp. SK013]|uniref:AbgT family transporter n=1 Tax=Shimia sp. SK013 TaxID=1389006 RepID=UPI0006B64EB2|nr:AbgT family transporter [Shimia sp. SK013]KPA22860.1 p-aminobenzoyl-glutamate transport protein [Shimia sp. SK013]